MRRDWGRRGFGFSKNSDRQTQSADWIRLAMNSLASLELRLFASCRDRHLRFPQDTQQQSVTLARMSSLSLHQPKWVFEATAEGAEHQSRVPNDHHGICLHIQPVGWWQRAAQSRRPDAGMRSDGVLKSFADKNGLAPKCFPPS